MIGRTLALVGAALLATPAIAAEPTAGDWRGFTWGMTAADIAAHPDPVPERLPGRWDFGAFYADQWVRDVEEGGVRFDAFLQIDRASGRLGQVLLDRRAPLPSRDELDALGAALEAQYGPPDAACDSDRGTGGPSRLAWVWRLPDTVVTLSMLDFAAFTVLTEDRPRDPELFGPVPGTRIYSSRELPRRLLLRFTDARLPIAAPCEGG